MSYENNLLLTDYYEEYTPNSWRPVYLPYEHNCPNPKYDTSSSKNNFALEVPFMNSIAAANIDNRHIATINKSLTRLPQLSQNSSSSLSSNLNYYSLSDNDLNSNCHRLNSEREDNDFTIYQEYQEPMVENFSNHYQKIESSNCKKNNINTFPLAWTCYKDKNNCWNCPLRGDKPS